jgi:hypothetical protein
MNDELEIMWMELAMAYSKHSPEISLGLREITELQLYPGLELNSLILE